MDELEPTPFRDPESIDNFLGKIRHEYEREFANLLLEIPHLSVQYEAHCFKGTDEYKDKSTWPDFKVRNLKNPHSKGFYIEITSSENPALVETDPSIDPKPDSKAKQKAILWQNGVNHIIFYRDKLEYIEEHHKVDLKLPPKNKHTVPTI